MEETKEKLFKEWSEVDGFVGAGLGENCIFMYWKDIVSGNAPMHKNGYNIEHQVTGEITTQ